MMSMVDNPLHSDFDQSRRDSFLLEEKPDGRIPNPLYDSVDVSNGQKFHVYENTREEAVLKVTTGPMYAYDGDQNLVYDSSTDFNEGCYFPAYFCL